MGAKNVDSYHSKARRLLNTHIRQHWPSQVAFADALAMSTVQLNRYITGRLQPNLENAFAIENLTKQSGKPVVYAKDWLSEK
ncbi:MAG: helix-turn-helix transcriptional regulator [Deltaproteobacteria bacterium]|nr:helix-turn-helix transcriptional regulator [Deltaproteobacteria bacterium]